MIKSTLILNKSGTEKNNKASKKNSQLYENKGGSLLIDWLLKALSKTNYTEINISSQINLNKISKSHLELNYYYSKSKKSLSSVELLKAAKNSIKSGALIIDSGIILREDAIKSIESVDKDFVIGVEKIINKNNLKKAKLSVKNGIVCLSSKKNSIPIYFSGVFKIKDKIAEKFIKEVESLSQEKKSQNTEDLIAHLLNKNFKIYSVDIGQNWAKIDRPMTLSKFIFGTKAETLERLSDVLKSATVLPQVRFTVKEWKKNKVLIIKKINQHLNSNSLVVRSSSSKEDSFTTSNAGTFLSLLAVPNTPIKIKKSVEKVIKSYGSNKGDSTQMDQVLIQPFLRDISSSGVILTADQSSRSPYNIINYENESGTEGVTSGKGRNLITQILSKNVTHAKSNNIQKILDLSRELSTLVQMHYLDIEYAIDKSGCLYLLQVRPLIIKNTKEEYSDNYFFSELKKSQKKFNKIAAMKKGLAGNKTALGNMTDWNPAEMIGNRPKELSYSLYKKLITDKVWAQAREKAGYKKIKNHKLMHSISGHPYIDIRVCFNSFLPSKLNKNISNKLIDFYISKLEINPELHDKVEFEVIPTCIDFNFIKYEKLFLKANFNQNEINLYKIKLKKITNNLILQKSVNIKNELDNLYFLESFRKKQLKKIIKKDAPFQLKKLISYTIKFGTLTFSKLARNGFIAISFLNSMLDRKIISKIELEKILESIPTIASDFTEKVRLLKNKEISINNFLEQFGHLRPGTYDILSPNYRENYKDYFSINPNEKTIKSKKVNKENFIKKIFYKKKKEIINLINEENFQFTSDELLMFILESIPAREYAKFIFTRSVDQMFTYINLIGMEFNFSKDEMANLPIESFTSKNIKNKVLYRKELMNKIERNKKIYNFSTGVRLPDIIFSSENISSFTVKKQTPNFITNKSIEGKILTLEPKGEKKDLKNAIVLIENADPGFDWIFSHDIKGLITKYGGAASHMAIRTGEFQIPAAIGCGGAIYDEIKKFRYLKLDCASKNLVIIS